MKLETAINLAKTLDQHNVVLIGGFAIRTMIKSRSTDDVDFIISRSDLDNVEGYTESKSDNDFSQGKIGDIDVDFCLTSNPIFAEVKKNHTQTKMGVTVATATGILILKMFALTSLYRQGNFPKASVCEHDIMMMIWIAKHDMQAIYTILQKKMMESDINAVKEVIADIEAKVAKAKASKNK